MLNCYSNGSTLEVLENGDTRNQQWYVAETLSGKEALGLLHIRRQKFVAYCPSIRKWIRRGRKQFQADRPLFPGYIFVRFDPLLAPWHSLNGTIGVKRLVGFHDRAPRPMPEDAMRLLFQRCSSLGLISTQASYSPGQETRLVSSAFADQIATIESVDSQGRVRILLEILGSTRSVRVNRSTIVPR